MELHGTLFDLLASARLVWWYGTGARYETYHRRGAVAMAITAAPVASHHGSSLRQ